MKKILMIIAMGLIMIGCSAAQKKKVINMLGLGADVANTAGSAGVPFAGAVGGGLTLIGTTLAGLWGNGNKKQRLTVNYKATQAIDKAICSIADQLKSKKLDPEAAATLLCDIVENTIVPIQSYYGVGKKIKADVKKLQKKGDLVKLS